MSRLEEIKERIQRGQELYPDDPKILLERIEHLERANEKLERANEKLQGMVGRAENLAADWMDRYHTAKGEPAFGSSDHVES